MSMHLAASSQCMYPGCNIFDLLAVKCNRCGNVYCKDHFGLREHACTALTKEECVGEERPGGNPYPPQAIGDHPMHYTCDLKSCGRTDFAAVECVHCHLMFCVDHRFPETHLCTGRPAKKREKSPPPSRGLPSLSLLITLGKTQIHMDDQWPLHVAVIPKRVERHVVASRRWSVGKTVDALSEAIPEAERPPPGGRWRLATRSPTVDGGSQWTVTDTLASLMEAVPHSSRVLLVPETLVVKETGKVNIISALLPSGFK